MQFFSQHGKQPFDNLKTTTTLQTSSAIRKFNKQIHASVRLGFEELVLPFRFILHLRKRILVIKEDILRIQRTLTALLKFTSAP